ncbi:MAG: hypothetical protein ABSG96_23140 [Terracidiphilus sp.]
MVFYLLAVRHLDHRHEAAGRFGVTGRRRLAQRITGSRLRWIRADELKRMINADPELVVFHLLDDQEEAGSMEFGTEIGVTLPQLEEALVWMPESMRFAVYRVNGIAPELAQRLSGMTQGRQVLLLADRFSLATERFDGRMRGPALS